MGVCIRLGGFKLVTLALRFWSQLSLWFKIGLHFLNDSGVVAESSAPRVTHNIWQVPSLLNMWVPCINVSSPPHPPSVLVDSIWRSHAEVALWLQDACHLKVRCWKYICSIYMVSCVSVAKVNTLFLILTLDEKAMVPCSFNLLILILSWEFDITTLHKSILLPLKVTVTSFQFISNVSHK